MLTLEQLREHIPDLTEEEYAALTAEEEEPVYELIGGEPEEHILLKKVSK